MWVLVIFWMNGQHASGVIVRTENKFTCEQLKIEEQQVTSKNKGIFYGCVEMK